VASGPYKKYINEGVHGGLWISDLEERLIDTPAFQRLRHIRQGGLMNYVFPGAMLHDIGHYPFSHLGEAVYRLREGKKEDIFRGGYQSGSPLSFVSQKPTNDRARHERLGAQLILRRKEISDILQVNDLDPQEIGQIINGELVSGVSREKGLLYMLLMHSSLDVDRLDYLIRDSAHSGNRGNGPG